MDSKFKDKFKNDFESEAEEIMKSSNADFSGAVSEKNLNKNSDAIPEISDTDFESAYEALTNNSIGNISSEESAAVSAEKLASEAVSEDKNSQDISAAPAKKKPVTLIIAVIVIVLAAVAVYFTGQLNGDKNDKKSSSASSSEQNKDASASDGSDKDDNSYTPAEQGQEFKDYSDLTKDCFFNATAFTQYAGNGHYVLCTGTQVLDIMGEPERKENWTYRGQGGEFEVTSYYYNIDGGKSGAEPTLNFVFYQNTLLEIIIMEPIKFEGTDDLLSKFGLKTTEDSEVLINNDEQFRVTNCGINNFWAYAIEYSKDKTRGDAYCYLRYLEI